MRNVSQRNIGKVVNIDEADSITGLPDNSVLYAVVTNGGELESAAARLRQAGASAFGGPATPIPMIVLDGPFNSVANHETLNRIVAAGGNYTRNPGTQADVHGHVESVAAQGTFVRRLAPKVAA